SAMVGLLFRVGESSSHRRRWRASMRRTSTYPGRSCRSEPADRRAGTLARIVRHRGRTLWRLAKLGLSLAEGVAAVLGTLVGMRPVAHNLTAGASSVASPITLPPLGGISYLYDRYGNLQQSFNRQIRSPVDLDKVPTPVIGAV